jgi:hypothetical protein
MADSKISALAAVTTVDDTDEYVVARTGATKKITGANLKAPAQAALDTHTGDTTAAHAASAILADSTTLVGVGTDVQAVLEELDNGIADHLADTSDAHAGTAITNTPAGTIAATTVQAAINELDGEKAAAASTVMDGDAAGGVLSGTYPSPGFAADMATQAELDAHLDDTTDAHDASAISFTPNGSIAATDVQAAIQEVRDQAGSSAQTEVDFGTTPLAEQTFIITDARVTAGSVIIPRVSGSTPTGKDADEVAMDTYALFVFPGTGQFNLTIRGLEGYLADKFKIDYLIG